MYTAKTNSQTMANNARKVRNFKERMRLQNAYNKRSGLYKFLLQNLLKLFLVLLALGAILVAAEQIFDVKAALETMVTELPIAATLGIFVASESLLGLIPPDLFIALAPNFEIPYLFITLLGTLSYFGGINAYWLGRYITKFPRINKWIAKRNEKNMKQIKKWGGGIVVFAALFPLPFATISLLAGIVDFSFKKFLLYGLTRYIRFYVYAFAILKVLENL